MGMLYKRGKVFWINIIAAAGRSAAGAAGGVVEAAGYRVA
jgi:hypothetical protein